ncbi:MAG: ABC transporter ATP-binding protein, partial [Chloroflexota bacterium]
MGFILDGLESEDYDRQYSDRELLERIISYFRPYTREMILVAVMIALNSAATIAGPILIAKAIDMLSVQSSTRAIVLLSLGVMLLG